MGYLADAMYIATKDAAEVGVRLGAAICANAAT